MRIIFINRLMGIFRGGGEYFDLHIATALKKLGCDIQFVVGRHWTQILSPVDGFEAVYIRTPYLRQWHYRLSGRKSRVVRYISYRLLDIDLEIFYKAVLSHFDKKPPKADIFQICGMPKLGALLSERFHIPSVIWWPGPPGPRYQKWQKKCAASFSHGDALFHLRKNVDQHAWEIPLGLDRNFFVRYKNMSLRSHYNIPKEAIVLLFVGRLIPIKNVPFLLRGFAKAMEYKENLFLLIIGQGESESNIKHVIKKLNLGDKVILTGYKTGQDLVAHYNTADIFILTSKYENYPQVILEAMSCGLPIIATRVGGIPIQIQNGINGLLVDSNDEYELSKAIVNLASAPSLCERMGKANLEKARSFSWEKSAKKLLDLYNFVKC